MVDIKDYYGVLGVRCFATAEEIKKAYRLLAKKWHPDRNQGNEESAEIFKKINEAYYVLSKPDLKEDYDFRLRVYFDALKEARRCEGKDKSKKFAEAGQQLDSLEEFMQRMKVVFEKVVYEDENSISLLDELDLKYPKIAWIRRKAKKSLNELIDLMYEGPR